MTGPSAILQGQEAACFGLATVRGAHDLRGVITVTDVNHDGITGSGASAVVAINSPDQNQNVNNPYWTFTKLGNDNCNDLLEQNERFPVTVGGANGRGDLVDAPEPSLATRGTFDGQALAPGGTAPCLRPPIPAWLCQVNDLR